MLSTRERTSSLRFTWPQVGRRAAEFVIMAVMARATLIGDLSPFAVACFAAGLFAGCSPIAMTLGCAVGSPWESMGMEAVVPVAGCVIALVGYLALTLTPLGARLKDSRGARVFRSQDAVIAGLSGLAALLPPLVTARGNPQSILIAAASAMVAMMLSPVLGSTMSLTPKRTCLLPDEKLSLALFAMLGLIGLSRSPAHVVALPMAGLITLTCASLGAETGAAAGLVTGAALAFSHADPMIGASLGLMGLISGATAPLGRWWSALAFVMTNLATMMFGTGMELGTMGLGPAIAVGLAYALMPDAVTGKLKGWIKGSADRLEPDKLAGRLRQSTQKRLTALGTVFDELSIGYGEPVRGPDEQALIAQMRSALCTGCAEYARCWNGTDARARRMLCGLLGDALKGEPLSEKQELPPELGRVCRRASQMPRRLGALLTQFETRRRVALSRQGAGDTLARHFRQAREILMDMGDNLARPMSVDGEMSRLAWATLERAGFPIADVLALDLGAIEISVTLEEDLWTKSGAFAAAAALTRTLGIPMRAALLPDGEPAEREMRFVQSPRLAVTVGYASRARTANAPSGDTHLAAGLTGGRVLLALSDGMGSGARAAEESSQTIRLIRRFLLAEVDRALMLESINQLLLMRGGEDMFATADLCVLDMQEGNAEFLKLGACASFILRKDECIRVDGGRLPLGILDSVTPGLSKVKLKPGDMVIMISDGVADSAVEAQTHWLEAQLTKLAREAPGQLCTRLIEAACAREDAQKDDMTVLAAKISKA